jgi:phosphocarrier protein HPr
MHSKEFQQMIEKETVIINPTGLHARPATVFCDAAAKFNCLVSISKNGKTFNAKSIFKLLSAELSRGTKIKIICDGTDEEDACKRLTDLIDSGFGEEIV